MTGNITLRLFCKHHSNFYDNLKGTAGFVVGKGGGIKAVSPGVPITFLTAAIQIILLHTANLK
jgi:hypothetical protein